PGAGGAAADAVVGAGHQLLAALPRQPDVVDERRAGDRDISGRFRVQLPGRRAAGRAGPAAEEPRLGSVAGSRRGARLVARGRKMRAGWTALLVVVVVAQALLAPDGALPSLA